MTKGKKGVKYQKADNADADNIDLLRQNDYNHNDDDNHKDYKAMDTAIINAFAIVYGILMFSVAISFPFSASVTVRSKDEKVFYYQIFLLYMLIISVLFQLFCVCTNGKRLLSQQQTPSNLKPFGTNGFRYTIGVFSIGAIMLLTIDIIVRSKVMMTIFNVCISDMFRIVIDSAALLHVLLHGVVIHQNVKVFPSYHLTTTFGLIHLGATDFAGVLWLCRSFIQEHVWSDSHIRGNHSSHSSTPNDTECTRVLIINSNDHEFYHKVIPSFGVISIIFLHMGMALFVSAFVIVYGEGTMESQSVLTNNHKKDIYNKNHFTGSIPGILISSIIVIGTIATLIVYFLIENRDDSSLILMSVAIGLTGVSISCLLVLLIGHINTPELIIRNVMMETFVLGTALCALFVYNLFYFALNAWTDQPGPHVKVHFAASLLFILEASIQMVFILNSLQYYGVIFQSRRWMILQKNMIVVLIGYNLAMTLIFVVPQIEEAYDSHLREDFNVHIWAWIVYVFRSFVLMFRVYSIICLGTLWARILADDSVTECKVIQNQTDN